MTAAHQLSREEVLALPPTTSLAKLAGCLGVSEPTVRAARRSGELERLGIRVNRLGAQWRVVTATVWEHLGISPADRASTAPATHKRAGHASPTASALRAVADGGGLVKAEDRAPAEPGLPTTTRPAPNGKGKA